MGSSRMLTSIIILIVIILLFHFGGLIPEETPTGYILSNLGLTNPENLGSTSFYLTLVLLTTISTAGIIIGSLARLTPDTIMFMSVGIPLSFIMFSIGWDIIVIFNILKQTNNMLAVMICSPLLVAYFFTIYDYLRGRD